MPVEPKHSFCIHVPGMFNDGLNSLVRGEGRWTMSIGRLLAERGHRVSLIGNPGWGSVPECKVIPWWDYKTIFESNYNFYLDSSWYNAVAPRNCSIPSEVYVRCFWGVDDQYDTIRKFYDNRHWCAYPTLEVWSHLKDHKNSKYGLFLPMPIIKTISNNDNFNGDFIIWPLKNPFEFEHMTALAEFLFNLMLVLARKYKLKPIILFSDCLDHDHKWGPLTPPYITNLLRKAKEEGTVMEEGGVKFLDTFVGRLYGDGAPHEHLLGLLSRSKLMLTNGDPPASPMYAEAVAQGCVPLVWGPSLFNTAPEELGVSLKKQHTETFDRVYCEDVLQPTITKMLEDKDFYTLILSRFKKEAEVYLEEKTYNIIINNLTEVLQRVRIGVDL